MKLRLVTLSEDRASFLGFIGELGLSILIESDEGNILFDTGQDMSAAYNADILGIDLEKVDKIVLSHGHADHTGGLRKVLSRIRKKEIEVIAHPDVWATKWARVPALAMDRYIGIPFQRTELERLGARFRLTKESTRVSDNIITTGEIPMITEFEKLSPSQLVKEGTEEKPDEVLDDQAVVITTNYGLIVITGCAHRGVINTIYHAQKLTGISKVYMVVGGIHLIDPDNQPRIKATIDALKELGVQKVGVSHCTGLPASVQMAQALGDRFFFNNAGTVTTVE